MDTVSVLGHCSESGSVRAILKGYYPETDKGVCADMAPFEVLGEESLLGMGTLSAGNCLFADSGTKESREALEIIPQLSGNVGYRLSLSMMMRR